MIEGEINISKQLNAAFFFPAREEDLRSLVETAGVKDVKSARGITFGQWAGIYCECLRERIGAQDLLQLGLHQAEFLDCLAEDREDRTIQTDPSWPLTRAFYDSCCSLRADVAFLVSHIFRDKAYIRSHASLVGERNVDELIAEKFGLLYLSEELAQDVDLPDDRDTLACESGVLIFASTGWGRWF